MDRLFPTKENVSGSIPLRRTTNSMYTHNKGVSNKAQVAVTRDGIDIAKIISPPIDGLDPAKVEELARYQSGIPDYK